MGKGSRSRMQYAEKQIKKQEKRQEEIKKEKTNRFFMRIIYIVIAIIIGSGGIYYFAVYSNGNYLRNQVVAYTDDFEVDNAMLTYYFDVTYESLESSYGDYFSLLTGIDDAYSLKVQSYDDDQSWFSYLLDSTITDLTDKLALAEGALVLDLDLTDEDYVIIDRYLEDISEDYLHDGVNLDDIKKCLEIDMLAQKYTDEVLATIDYEEVDLTEYFDSYGINYKYLSYLTYTVSFDDEDETAYSYEEATAIAEELAASSSYDDFVSIAGDLLLATDEELTDDEILASLLVEDATYSSSDSFSIWAFETPAEIDETYTYDDETSSITVYYITEEAAVDSSVSVDALRLNFSYSYDTIEEAQAAAEEVLALYNEDPTEENFRSLVAPYSDDSSSITVEGFYENLIQGYSDEEIDEWLFDEAREYGDVDMIVTDSSVELLFYLEEGDVAYVAEMKTDLAYVEYISLLEYMIETYVLTYDLATMYDIPA